MREADPLGDLTAALSPTPIRPVQPEEQPEDSPMLSGFLEGAATTTQQSLRPSQEPMTTPGVFDLDITAVRHCRYPCDVPWHRH